MYISESTFLHLHQAEDERRNREVEYRRIALERAVETEPTKRRGMRELFHPLRRSEPLPRRRLSHP